jgi:hypothetical protein
MVTVLWHYVKVESKVRMRQILAPWVWTQFTPQQGEGAHIITFCEVLCNEPSFPYWTRTLMSYKYMALASALASPLFQTIQ